MSSYRTGNYINSKSSVSTDQNPTERIREMTVVSVNVCTTRACVTRVCVRSFTCVCYIRIIIIIIFRNGFRSTRHWRSTFTAKSPSVLMSGVVLSL